LMNEFDAPPFLLSLMATSFALSFYSFCFAFLPLQSPTAFGDHF
jgi:hypothetical protein